MTSACDDLNTMWVLRKPPSFSTEQRENTRFPRGKGRAYSDVFFLRDDDLFANIHRHVTGKSLNNQAGISDKLCWNMAAGSLDRWMG